MNFLLLLQPKVYRATSCDHVSGDELTVCQGIGLPSVPPFELLVDGHHLDILVLLDVVPWSGVRLGPDDCTSIESEIGERGVRKYGVGGSLLGPRARRVRYHEPPATTAPTTT